MLPTYVNFMQEKTQITERSSEFFMSRIKDIENDYITRKNSGKYRRDHLQVYLNSLDLNIKLLKRFTGINYETNVGKPV